MCWTPLYVNKNKSHGTQNVKTLNRTTQYVLDTSICKQKQITRNSRTTQDEDKQNTICVGQKQITRNSERKDT